MKKIEREKIQWDKIEWFDMPERPKFRIGMRLVKTGLAVYICMMIGYVFNHNPFFAMIAAILCMQASREKSALFAFNRTIGTTLGAVCGTCALYVAKFLNLTECVPLYYAFMCILVLFLIETTVVMRKPSISAFTCIVFFSVTIIHVVDESPMVYAFTRMWETMIGIFVSLFVNFVLPDDGRERVNVTHREQAIGLGDAVYEAAPDEMIGMNAGDELMMAYSLADDDGLEDFDGFGDALDDFCDFGDEME